MSRDRLLGYFERELAWLRKQGQEFSARFPAVAAALDIKAAGTTDPHVERIIESFAFLTARVNQKIDDTGAAVSASMLEILFPHLMRPIPSVAIAQICPDPSRGKASTVHLIRRGSQLHSPPVMEQSCLFSTCYDVALAPVTIVAAEVGSLAADRPAPREARSVLRLELAATGGARLCEVSVDRLRLYLAGGGHLPFRLYELLLNDSVGLATTAGSFGGEVPAPSVLPVGMGPEEGLLPYSEATPPGHRLLLEYLCFPHKFLFVDLLGLAPHVAACSEDTLTVEVFSRQPPQMWARDVSARCFQLGCTPIVNTFERPADPIAVDHRSTEYRIVPHPYRYEAMEVYAVSEVQGISSSSRRPVPYRPLYVMEGAGAPRTAEDRFWVATRRASTRAASVDGPTDVYLSVIDRRGEHAHLDEDILRATVVCTNHNLPSQLPFDGRQGHLSMAGSSPGIIRCLTRPTPSLRKGLAVDAQWQLVSLLSLGYSSLSDPALARSSLQQMLRLLDPTEGGAVAQQIRGIAGVAAAPVSARIDAVGGASRALGLDVEVELDPEAFVGGSPFLFGSVLERYFGALAPLNSFTRTSIRLSGQEGYLRRWGPRSSLRSLA